MKDLSTLLENRLAEWVPLKDAEGNPRGYACSHCGTLAPYTFIQVALNIHPKYIETRYCSGCGYKMGGTSDVM